MSKNSSDAESVQDSADEGSQISHVSIDSGSESESEASETQGFLDDMAEEGDDTEQSDQDDDDDDDDDLAPSFSFPQFTRLPIELRQKIWELFCPELTSRSLTLDFSLSEFQGTTSRFWHLSDGIGLYDGTKATRAVLAVHQESRAMALKRFPDSIPIQAEDADAIIRFHPDKDVPVVNGLCHVDGLESPDQCRLPECFDTLKHVAIGDWEFKDQFHLGILPVLIHKFGNLKSLFLCISSTSVQRKKLVWCTSKLVHRHYAEVFERGGYGYGENLQYLFCWPNLESHADFAKFQIPQGFADSVPATDSMFLQNKGVDVWPMIAFEYKKGLRRYDSLEAYELSGFDDGSEGESTEDSGAEEESDESGTDLDQYESEGIDDEEINHVDPDEDDEISIDGHVEDQGSEAHFSSPEPEPEPELVNRTKKRRIVEDSDDEDEEAQPAAKRSRVIHVVSSDSEDEAPKQSERLGRAARVVVSDSESDDEDGGAKTKAAKADAAGESSSDDSESQGSEESEEESESDDEEESPQRMSLAERLRLHRRDNPIEDNGEGGSGDDDLVRDSGEEEDDESEDDRPRGGASMFFDGMADEEDGEDEEEEYEYDDSFL